MSLDDVTLINEARRQIEVCNACRYCEGFCSVFPAMTRDRFFSDGTITHLANLCHNCRGCHYSCQYTEPHEFALNLPAALAEVRQESWERFVGPAALAKAFHSHGLRIAIGLSLASAAMFWVIAAFPPASGSGFYQFMAHGLMVAIFVPTFLLPLVAVAVGLRRYWREVEATRPTWADFTGALRQAASMRNLAGGQGQGCNFEKEDRYSNARRHCHQAIMYGFLLCFAATGTGTLMHYLFDWPAPYGLLSPPKMLGVPGGILLTLGTIGMAILKTKAERKLGAVNVWSGEMAFILLLGAVALTGLALYASSGTSVVPVLLALHLGTVLTLFLLTPYTKMVHGFFRLAALIAEEQKRRKHA